MTAYCLIPNKELREPYLKQLRDLKLDEPPIPSLVATIAAYTEGAPWLQSLRGLVGLPCDGAPAGGADAFFLRQSRAPAKQRRHVRPRRRRLRPHEHRLSTEDREGGLGKDGAGFGYSLGRWNKKLNDLFSLES